MPDQQSQAMIHLVTFASSDMSKSAELCAASARQRGVDFVDDWRWSEIQSEPFYQMNKGLLDQARGYGLWAWKPFIILNRISRLFDSPNPNHVVIYADAGIEFINNVNHIIDRMDQDIFLFGNMWEHAHWCKRDIVETIWPDTEVFSDESNVPVSLNSWARFGKQAQASVIFFRVSDYTRRFVKEWLDWCLFEGGRLIDDSPSRTPNHPEFRENRHDQSVLTTLAYREGLRLHWWPASYNDGSFIYERGEYPDEGYPVIVNHHRKRNDEWSVAA